MTTSQSTPSTHPRRLRRRIGLAALAVGLVAVPIAAGAADSDTEPSYTGCLDGSGADAGRIYAVGPGSAPLSPCAAGDKPLALSGGDLTSITAGSGLRATSGDAFGITDTQGAVTLDLAPGYRLPQGCTTGKPVTKSTTGWQCGSFPEEPTYDRIYSGTSQTRIGAEGGNISDDWANIADPLTIPAGDWHLTASARISTEDELSPSCRLDVVEDFYTRLDQTYPSDDGSGIFLQGVMSTDVPFTVAVACRDHGWGSRWAGLNIVATEGHGLHRRLLNVHE